ncbi:hypothetical protein V1512DRAFT_267702 [Lipomyces arxii]|uniref:uncharacterized protein n=1 Tax=Lipomyces arxii TaxID=56418 RepID=UPI0034CEC4A7
MLSSQFPEIFIPTAPQLSLLFTFISNPQFATTTKKREIKSDSVLLTDLEGTGITDTSFADTPTCEVATRLLAKVLKAGVPIKDLGFDKVFSIQTRKVKRALPPTTRKRACTRFSDPIDDVDEDGVIRSKNMKLMWQSADRSIRRIISWGFRCASAYGVSRIDKSVPEADGVRTLESRWPIWRTVLMFIVEILERDWHEAFDVNQEIQTNETEAALRQTLWFTVLKGTETDDYVIDWKSALKAIFACNTGNTSASIRPIYSTEVNKKSRLRTFDDNPHCLCSDSYAHSFGDVIALDLRRRLLGLLYDAITLVPGLIDQQTFFREMTMYMRDSCQANFAFFLEAPTSICSSKSDYTVLLCDAILQPLALCPVMPKNWLYSYEKGKMYMAEYLQLCPIEHRVNGKDGQVEDVIKVALVVETLFKTWVKVRLTAIGAHARTKSPQNTQSSPALERELIPDSQPSEDGVTDEFDDSIERGIVERMIMFMELEPERKNVKQHDNWDRLRLILISSGTHITLMKNSLKS